MMCRSFHIKWLGTEGGSNVEDCVARTAAKFLAHNLQVMLNIKGLKGKAALEPLDDVIIGKL